GTAGVLRGLEQGIQLPLRREAPAGAPNGLAIHLEDPGPFYQREPTYERRQVIARRSDRRMIPVDEMDGHSIAGCRDKRFPNPQISMQQRLRPAEGLQQLHPPWQLVPEPVEAEQQTIPKRVLFRRRLDAARHQIFEPG